MLHVHIWIREMKSLASVLGLIWRHSMFLVLFSRRHFVGGLSLVEASMQVMSHHNVLREQRLSDMLYVHVQCR